MATALVPTSGCGSAIGFTLLLLYFGNERSCLHWSVVEQVFWPLIYGWFAWLWVACAQRSPPIHGDCEDACQSTLMDTLVVVLAALVGLAVHMHNRGQRMASSVSRRDLQQLAKPYVETVAARIATARVSRLLSSRRRHMGLLQGLAHELKDTLTGHAWRVRGSLFQALQECAKAGPQDLLYVLNSDDVDLPRLFVVAGTDGVLGLLCDQVPHMDVVTKARLVDALHRQPDFKHLRRLQRAAVEMLRQTHGRELTTLKNLIDEVGDYYNLHRLIFHELASDLREAALGHIEQEGQQLRREDSELPLKILSDIDDTLYSSGGRFPAGVDARFDRGEVYPGVLALFRELDRQKCGRGRQSQVVAGDAIPTAQARGDGIMPLWLRVSSGEWEELAVPCAETVAELRERMARSACVRTGHIAADDSAEISFMPPAGRAMSNLVFLSARPHAYKDYAESRSFRLFRRLRAQGLLHCRPTLIAGRMSSSGRAAVISAIILFKPHLCAVLSLLLAAAVAIHREVLTALSLLMLGAFAGAWAAAKRQRSPSAAWRPVGVQKAQALRQYQQLYSECSTVFFGDNGQGDLWCGEQVASTGSISAVFIHEVLPRGAQLTSLAGDKAAGWRRLNIHFYRTYVGAAVSAHQCGLISQAGLARVAHAAVDSLVRLRLTDGGRLRDWAPRVSELNADVASANSLLPEGLRVSSVPQAVAERQHLRCHSRSFEAFEFRTEPPELAVGTG